MKQQEIDYKDIIRLGFTENEDTNDKVYFNKYGFEYVIITKQLTKDIYIDWPKETRLCEMVRTDSEGYIESTMPIRDLEHLEVLIDFFGSYDEEGEEGEKEYEVLEEYGVTGDIKIFSIKRLSDGEVFNVGSNVNGDIVRNGVIKGFKVDKYGGLLGLVKHNTYGPKTDTYVRLKGLKHHEKKNINRFAIRESRIKM